ncbi:serine/threonine protein kinase [Micrococcales bacterium KH10]|nr:serine/threonine protein kinase [Micrococcales bacterium KH10]
MVDEVPRILAGRYEVGELIGRGGMAEVHIGHDTRLGRTVAIKILRSDLARDPAFQARFRREAQAAAALNHPAIVAVYDTGEDNMTDPATGAVSHVPFIVMEYVEGHTVRDILRNGNAVPIEEAIEITVGVLSALDYSHRAGIVHRDIKPANVMLTPTGSVKVMDFGIARALADSAATMTQTQAVVGTAQYLSPEQARGEQVDARSDLYSTGCLLYELLTGRPPFVGDSPVSVAYQHVRENPAPPSSIASDVPPVLDQIVLKALAKDRELRYGTAAAFRNDLESALKGGQVLAAAPVEAATQVLTPSPAWPATPTGPVPTAVQTAPIGLDEPLEDEEDEKKNKALMWTLIGVAVAAIIAIIVILIVNSGGDDEPEVPMEVFPSVATTHVDDALAEISAAGFTSTPEIVKQPDDEIEEGIVIESDPPGGTEAPLDTAITLVVSAGSNAVEIPDVSKLSYDDARNTLETLGLKVASGGSENHADIERDLVTRTDPESGTTVSKEDTVTIYVSTGMVEMPSLVDRSRAEAEEELAKAGLTGNFTEEATDEVRPDRVMSQSEPGGSSVPQKSTIDITISAAIPKIAVPDVSGYTETAAQNRLNEVGLAFGETERIHDASVPAGTVIRTKPKAGRELKQGTTVDLVVSLGPLPQDPEPDPTDPGDIDPENP